MARLMWTRVAAVGLLIAISCGAFGAHWLRDLVSAQLLETWQTAVTYQVWMALTILALASGVYLNRARALWCFAFGALIFSGSLYVLVLMDLSFLGAVTPIGGVLMILGCIFVVIDLAR